MNRQQVLQAAMSAVSVERNVMYGEPEVNQARIAALWTVLFGHPVTPRQVAWAMVLTKVARDIHAPQDDNVIDAAGYAAVAGEVGSVDHVHPWAD